MRQINAIKAAKQNLRKSIASKLSMLQHSDIVAQSSIVSNKVKQTVEFQNASSVALYMSMPGIEVDTLELIRHCFEQKKHVYLPSCCDNDGKPTTTMRFLKVDSFDQVTNLEPRGKYKLREPETGEDAMNTGSLDIIIVPGVAFTTEGYRLGHGAGYYDRYISSFEEKFKRRPYLVGVGLFEQLVESLPTEHHDWTLDKVHIGGPTVQK